MPQIGGVFRAAVRPHEVPGSVAVPVSGTLAMTFVPISRLRTTGLRQPSCEVMNQPFDEWSPGGQGRSDQGMVHAVGDPFPHSQADTLRAESEPERLRVA